MIGTYVKPLLNKSWRSFPIRNRRRLTTVIHTHHTRIPLCKIGIVLSVKFVSFQKHWGNSEMANVPSRVVELIETFDRNIEAYRSQQYNEAQFRREFIDPFPHYSSIITIRFPWSFPLYGRFYSQIKYPKHPSTYLKSQDYFLLIVHKDEAIRM